MSSTPSNQITAIESPSKCALAEGSHSLSTPVRFLILSDTHGAKLPEKLPPCDVLLHCGDLTENGTPERIRSALQDLGKIEAKLKLVIAGNHEISLDKLYWLSQGGTEADAERALALLSPETTLRRARMASPFYGKVHTPLRSHAPRLSRYMPRRTLLFMVHQHSNILPTKIDSILQVPHRGLRTSVPRPRPSPRTLTSS
jgi:predicted phosphodiesterase